MNNPFVVNDTPCGGFQHCAKGAKPRMHPARYKQLMDGQDQLAVYEVQQGWHFCEWHDQMLIVAQSTPLCSCPTPDEIRAAVQAADAEKKDMLEMGIVAKHAPEVVDRMKKSYAIQHDDGTISGVIYG